MDLVVISPPKFLSGESRMITRLFEAGLERFHVRKDTADPGKVADYLRMIPALFHARISLHRHHELRNEFGVGGLHFNRFLPFVRGDYGNLILSQSVHATEEIENVDSDMDYIFLGPIFESLSKMDHTGRFDLRELTHFLKAYSGRLRIYALSGITESRIKEIREMGFHGCAVLGRIWNTFSTSGESATLKTFNTLHLNTIHARNN